MEIIINGDSVRLLKLKYELNDRVALFLEEEGEPYAVLSVNLPNEPMKIGEVAIDVNNLGKGIITQLVNQGIIDPPESDKWVLSGYVQYPICKLLI
jgi:hypothetical protein